MNQYFSMFTTPQAGDIFISWALIHDLSCWERIMRMKTKHWKRVTWLWRWAENWLKLSPNMKFRTYYYMRRIETWWRNSPLPKNNYVPMVSYFNLLLTTPIVLIWIKKTKLQHVLYVRLILRLKMLKGGIHVWATPFHVRTKKKVRLLNLETPFLRGGLHNVLHILQLVGLNSLLQRPEIGFELCKRA